jgi:membrane-associated protein
VVAAALIPWLDPQNLIEGFGAWALLVVCFIVFAETGLLIGFILPGDTLLIIAGVLAFPGPQQVIRIDIWWVCLAIGVAAFLGGEVGYLIGHKAGPRIFERKESGFFSVKNVERTNAFFTKYGVWAIVIARFVPIVRTFAPVAAGVGHMNYRKYSLFNLVGALLWGAGVTFLGYMLSYIPPVKDFVVNYIDLILLGAVLIAVIPTAYHTIKGIVASRRMKGQALDEAGAEALVLDLDNKPKQTD